ncbi:MAG: ABC transporter ATP-binding protein [Actinobacteria bacterium]|nr:ABC transporter ATP-binding protein [Actinomycetota bacterium]
MRFRRSHRGRFPRRERRRSTSRCQGRRTLTDLDSHRPEGHAGGAPLLTARGVGRRYGPERALAGATLELRAGEAVALVGPNGAGKSTLLAVLAGSLAPSEGHLVVRDPPPRVGWVPQRPAQYGRLSARENLELFARLEGIADPGRAAARMLGLVDLADERRSSGRLSVGSQQRLNLAIALLAEPDVLLLDEPTAALDPAQRRRLWQIVADVKERGGAVAFATQNLDEVAHFADAVVALRGGEIVFSGTRAEYDRTNIADVVA